MSTRNAKLVLLKLLLCIPQTLLVTLIINLSDLQLTRAEATELPDGLGQFPILQFFGGLITLVSIGVGSIFFIWGKRSEANKLAAEEKTPQSVATELYFSGPLQAIFQSLQDLKTAQLGNKLEHKDILMSALSTQRHALLDKMQLVQIDITEKLNDALDIALTQSRSNAEQITSLRDFMVRMEERDKHLDRAMGDLVNAINSLNGLIGTVSSKIDRLPQRRGG